MPDELETILALVADGRLSPEEAAPIIEALTRARQATDAARAAEVEAEHLADEGFGRHADRLDRRLQRAHLRIDRAIAHAQARIEGAGGRQLRIQVKERGRQSVNLRIPIGFVDAAIGFVPGIGDDQAERIRQAVRAGELGPIIDVEDPDGDGVLITLE
jgi:hypothetical protein